MSEPPATVAAKQNAIVVVGHGRGFVLDAADGPFVVTAAHCLPQRPPPSAASRSEERTYPNLIAPLGATPSIWCECLFVDPVADIAVLSAPDADLGDAWDTYDALVGALPGLRLGSIAHESAVGWLYSLESEWQRCTLQTRQDGRWLNITDAPRSATAPGTSGSPVLLDDGRVVGIVSTGLVNPGLVACLPGWMLTISDFQEMRRAVSRRLDDLQNTLKERLVSVRIFHEANASEMHC